MAIPPKAVAVHLDRPSGSPRNTWPATIESVEGRGATVRLHLSGPVPIAADVTATAADELGLRAAARVWVAIKATETTVYALS